MQKPDSICLIGTGKLAWHLAEKLQQKRDRQLYIWGRNAEKAAKLAEEFGLVHLHATDEIPANCAVILCVSDHSIQQVAQEIQGKAALILHLSGTQSLELIRGRAPHTAVMWPNQSFTLNHAVDWKYVPLSLEASDETAKYWIDDLVNELGGPSAYLSGEQRRKLHLAAVAANNFVNHLMVLTEEWCSSNGLDFQFLMPMIEQSMQRLKVQSPALSQTGPASRNDWSTITTHLSMLQDNPQFKELYALMSKQIADRYKK